MTNLLAAYNWLDLTIVLIMICALGIGFVQGILRQVIGLAAFYIAIVLGAQYYYPVSGFIRGVLFLQTSPLLDSIAFFIIVIAVWLLLTGLAADAYSSTKIRFAPLLDQLGGGVLALATIIAVLALIAPVAKFMVSERWISMPEVYQVLAVAIHDSALIKQLIELNGQLIVAIAPWMPYGIPSMFKFK